jgi:hypothetical protein
VVEWRYNTVYHRNDFRILHAADRCKRMFIGHICSTNRNGEPDAGNSDNRRQRSDNILRRRLGNADLFCSIREYLVDRGNHTVYLRNGFRQLLRCSNNSFLYFGQLCTCYCDRQSDPVRSDDYGRRSYNVLLRQQRRADFFFTNQ